MAYIVTKNIIDTKDNNRLYEEGEIFPRQDLVVSDDRIKELLGKGVIASDGAAGDLTPEAHEDKVTTKDLKAKLDELGIKYSSRASKEELKALLAGAEEE